MAAPVAPSAPESARLEESLSGPAGASARFGAVSGLPSVGERIKRTAQSVAEAARNAVPTKRSEPFGIGTTGGGSRFPAVGSSPTMTGPIPASGAPRKVRLAVARIDPWSVMKLSFLFSVGIGIMIVVATAVVWYTLDGLAVFTKINATVNEIMSDAEPLNLLDILAFKRIVSLSVMIAGVDIVLLTALSTISAFLYNIVAALVGGINLTLTDD